MTVTELIERLRAGDPSALEEVGHRFLPMVQAALLAEALEVRDPDATLKAFAQAAAHAARTSTAAAFGSTVLAEMRKAAASIPVAKPEGAQADALARLARLRSMPANERQLVLARFVERLPAQRIAEDTGLEVAALLAVLSRGAALLVGPPAGGGDWDLNPSLADPDAASAPQFMELENQLSVLTIDVTALELSPVLSPIPLARPELQPRPPAEHYPSQVHTQGALDLPAQVSRFVATPEQALEAATAQTQSELPPVADTRPMRAPPNLTPQAPGSPATPEAVEPLPAFRDGDVSQTDLIPASAVITKPFPELNPASAVITKPFPELNPAVQAGPEVTPIVVAPLRRPPSAPASPEVTPIIVGPLRRAPPAQPDDITAPRGKPLLARRPVIHRTWWWGATGSCAVLGLGLYLWGISRVHGATRGARELVPVIVAARDLPEGELLTLDAVATRSVPEQFSTPSVVKPDLLSAALGQRLSVALQAGDPLQWAQFESARSQQRLSRRVSRAQRAYSIPVNEVKSVGGWLEPNQFADLVLTVGKGETEAVTLAQNVPVLAVGKVATYNLGGAHLKYTTLSLMITPAQAEELAEALRVGTLTATLRADGDTSVVSREGRTTLQTLIDGTRVRALESRRLQTIQTIRRNH